MPVARQRDALQELTKAALDDLGAVWDRMSAADAVEVRDALIEVLPALGDRYGAAAAALAAEYYDTERERAEAKGRFEPVVPQDLPPARWEALARWGVDPLFAAEPDTAAALSLVSGGLQRSIADQHRLTVVESSVADPAASGWRRATRAGACGFCRMLAGRGGVYSESSVEFKSHDNCHCTAKPEFASNVTKVIGVPFKYSERKANWSEDRKRQENQRVYDYLKNAAD
ncbi:hypothetical protein EEW87_004290 [Janibacter melonis]|uniref:Uncharacterized protein n=1 Tax=Janibacter melonis TaxID=262209 RepID=A0A5P8FKB6_9MICO|nr:hypothetical protein [Janibacter melonis]QFQ29718.2 hypothetical protein EEW87_004290 [Janibacter melonis]